MSNEQGYVIMSAVVRLVPVVTIVRASQPLGTGGPFDRDNRETDERLMTASVCGDVRHRHVVGRCGEMSEKQASSLAVLVRETVRSLMLVSVLAAQLLSFTPRDLLLMAAHWTTRTIEKDSSCCMC